MYPLSKIKKELDKKWHFSSSKQFTAIHKRKTSGTSQRQKHPVFPTKGGRLFSAPL